MTVGLGVSVVVFALIAVREWLPAFLKIWHVMLAGALVLLLSGAIVPEQAVAAVDWNIIVYLFSVFFIGRALYDSGVSHRIAERMLALRSPAVTMGAFVATFALIAAVVTNDAAAIIGTPIALVLARRTGGDPVVFLIALCVTVTVGSMATPIGNPQNLLIAASGDLASPVLTYFLWLIVPTLVCLALVVAWLVNTTGTGAGEPPPEADAPGKDAERASLWPLALAIALLAILVVGESIASAIDPALGFPLGAAALVSALPVALFSRTRVRTVLHLDWPTLVFFVAMFIVTGGLMHSGSLQTLLGGVIDRMDEPPVTAAIAFFGSQIVSNVPLVDIYLKLTPGSGTANLMMLASISTLAGNVFIISAASNVIVLQMADRLGGPQIAFSTFARKVIPIGLATSGLSASWVLGLDALLGAR